MRSRCLSPRACFAEGAFSSLRGMMTHLSQAHDPPVPDQQPISNACERRAAAGSGSDGF